MSFLVYRAFGGPVEETRVKEVRLAQVGPTGSVSLAFVQHYDL